MVLKEVLILAVAVGFLLIWILELINGIPLKASYFWIMFSVGSLLYFQYTKNVRLKNQNKSNKN